MTVETGFDLEEMEEISSTWPAPVSLSLETKPMQPYPLAALPRLIRNAVSAYQQYGQQPLSLVAPWPMCH